LHHLAHTTDTPFAQHSAIYAHTQAVIRSALEAAGVSGSDVGGLELHGTGTPLGDPIELGAALSVYGPGARVNLSGTQEASSSLRSPLLLTALKSEMGHAEPAAGVC
jgi:acyl transferase domain-containing protein